MKLLEKILLVGGAGLLGYAIARRLNQPNLIHYYRGKVAVVTGGASGIGRSVVYQLRNLGASVLAVDRDERALARLAENFPGVETLAIDLTEADAPQQVLYQACEHFGHLDILFNNAGVVFVGPFWQMADADISRLVEINYTMQIRMTSTFLPYFFERRNGVIAYTGSLSAHVMAPTHSVYTGTKAGLNSFVGSLRRELPANCGVQLSIIHPNVTRTNLIDPALFDTMEGLIRVQSADEVAAAYLKGIARGAKEIFVRPADEVYKWVERLAPAYGDREFRKLFEKDPTRSGQPALSDGLNSEAGLSS